MPEPSWPMRVAVALPIAAMLGAALYKRHRRNLRHARLLAALAVGVAALAGGVAGWLA